ncbi:hypothetical protein TNCV_1060081 [Trichonephila clavipes]|nr:hypothetical protein TNCV_1060081 [Trichonephila clavipes]
MRAKYTMSILCPSQYIRPWMLSYFFCRAVFLSLPPTSIEKPYSSSQNPATPLVLVSEAEALNYSPSPQHQVSLSPMLYIYTHNFPTSPLVDICLFADDAAILSQSKTSERYCKTGKSNLESG